MSACSDSDTARESYDEFCSEGTACTETDDTRVAEIRRIPKPKFYMKIFAAKEEDKRLIADTRQELSRVLKGQDDRLAVIVGPCSIHDVETAVEYGRLIKLAREKYGKDLLIIMRVYFEKPRTTVGWKGLINDPEKDGSFDIETGVRMARQLLLRLAELRVPAATEFLDVIMPQYIADLISWGTIGARTTESQVHRELASGMSMPIGFKNGTSGNTQVAVEAIIASSREHSFLSVDKTGVASIVRTKGNEDCHVILRGSSNSTNYDAASVAETRAMLVSKGIENRIMIDCSHGNSFKKHEKQIVAASDIAKQVAAGSDAIGLVMIESNINEGSQTYTNAENAQFGVSITDACVGWTDKTLSEQDLRAITHINDAPEGENSTVAILDILAAAVRQRRAKLASEGAF